MSMKVLQDMRQVVCARRELMRRGVSSRASYWRRLLRRARIPIGIAIGDELKSWDVLSTLEFLDERLGMDAPILDIGSYASEIIVSLHKAGYTGLTGVDLDPGVRNMPFQDSIRYVVADFMHTPFNDASFEAVISISVIEHGYDADALLREIARLLKPGGYFVASFDYWPDKIDTNGHRMFGLDWMIFSDQDVADLIGRARRHGFTPVGELARKVSSAPIHFAAKNYTFAWLALVKGRSS